MTDNNEENLEAERTSEPQTRAEAKALQEKYEEGHLKRKMWLSLAVIGALLLGTGSAFAYEWWDRDRQAQSSLSEIVENWSEITAINTDVVDYGSDSYALGIGSPDNYPSNGTFIFGSEDGSYSYTINVYIDYSNSRSRDFFFANNTMLRGLIEASNAQVRIHPVPSDHPYSMYAAEAVAQIMHKHPDRAWEAHIALLQITDDILALEEPTPESMLGMIESELNRHLDISDVDTELIMDGMFTDWIAATGSDQRLQAGQYPPLVYSNGQLIDPSTYYDGESLRDSILAPEEQDFSDDDIAGEDNEDTGDEDVIEESQVEDYDIEDINEMLEDGEEVEQ